MKRAALILLCACGAAATVDPQLPPAASGQIDGWLAARAYLDWQCEPSAHAARPNGAHGTNRICSNDALSAHDGGGEYPVGSASVKEQFSSTGELNGYSVMVKTATGGGASWWWWERSGTTVFGGSNGASLCTGCHSGAPNDFVFTQVRP